MQQERDTNHGSTEEAHKHPAWEVGVMEGSWRREQTDALVKSGETIKPSLRGEDQDCSVGARGYTEMWGVSPHAAGGKKPPRNGMNEASENAGGQAMQAFAGHEVQLYPKGKFRPWSFKQGSDMIKLTF